MSPSLPQILIVILLILLIFGAGKLPKIMGDMANGIKAFKKGMKDDDESDDIKKLSSKKAEDIKEKDKSSVKEEK